MSHSCLMWWRSKSPTNRGNPGTTFCWTTSALPPSIPALSPSIPVLPSPWWIRTMNYQPLLLLIIIRAISQYDIGCNSRCVKNNKYLFKFNGFFNLFSLPGWVWTSYYWWTCPRQLKFWGSRKDFLPYLSVKLECLNPWLWNATVSTSYPRVLEREGFNKIEFQ